MSYLGVPPFGQTVRTVTTQTANGSANTFYPTGGYTVGYLDVFYNGVRVVEAQDYTAGDGNSVTFSAAPTANAVIEMVSYGPISFVDSLVRSGDTMGGTFYVRDLIPAANNTYSLGNSDYRFANLYLSGNTITIGDSTISANATSITFANSTGGAAEVMLPNTGVVSNTYGHSTGIPVVTVDRMGRISNVSIANTQPHYDTAYSNAVSVANTTSFNQAANAYANAVSDATNLAANAYANAVSVANTTSYNQAANAYANAVAAANTTSFNQAANAYANVFNGGTFSGNVVFTSNVTANTVRLNGSMQIDGDLIVSGNTVTMNVSSLAVEDNMIYLNDGSAVANPDIGIAGNYNDGTYRHTGVFRDATDGVWKFFHQYVPEPDASAYIDTANNTFKLANVQANTFIGNLSGDASTVGSNTASTLRSYSDTVANTAYSNATSYAATVAGTAYSNATSYAATVAGTAYSNATSFASNASNISTGTLSNSRLNSTVQTTTFRVTSSNANGNFGPTTMSWGGGEYPTLYSEGADRWIMHINPHICYAQNGVNGYNGTTYGSMVRFASNGSASSYWDIGVNGGGANLGADVFGLSRAGAWKFKVDTSRSYINTQLQMYNRIIASDSNNDGRTSGIWFWNNSDSNWAIYMAQPTSGTAPDGTTMAGGYWNNDHQIRVRAGNFGYETYDNTQRMHINSSGAWFASQIRTPIYYDSNDTGYYCDPNGTSRFGGGGNGDVIQMINSSYSAWLMIGGWTTDTSYSRIRTSDGNLHMDCQGGHQMYLNWYTSTNINCNGSIYAPAYYYNSDRRLKENIVSLSSNIISKLRPVDFNWIKTGVKDTGFIAQEVLEVLPSAVSLQEHNDSVGSESTYTLNDTAILAHAVKAIQELTEEVALLKAKLNDTH